MRRQSSTQRGAALLTAMLIVSLVASLAAAMVWRQYRAVQIEAAERARAQSGWILLGALDWARLILREDARANRSEPVDSLSEAWATPLAEARLSTFLAADKSNTDDGPEAFLSGSIADAQARYNLRNLLAGTEMPALELRTLQRLCESAGLPTNTATQLATALRAAWAAPSETTALRPQNIDQLAWLGLSRETIERLRPFVTLLPQPTAVNLNTAPREVIAALADGLDLASAERIVQQRQSQPLKSLAVALSLMPAGVTLGEQRAAVNSAFFLVSGRLRLDQRVVEERWLVQRRELEVLVLQRQRVNLSLGSP
ncbi:type II secretion system minor pseudopilin GspK [Roseateles sp.]|jgi:general secretion pathway protein K|uniref:type II secretion system minor pseudopilin GspK n=1 Tax=Roseateles sp. TaxID=1971397 RepID=UPI0037CBED21